MTTIKSTIFCDDKDCPGHVTRREVKGRIVLTNDPEAPFAVVEDDDSEA